MFRALPRIASLVDAFRMTQIRWATHKSGGSTANGRTSQPKYLGFKRMQDAIVETGNVILRQRGTRWHPGSNVGIGKDHTLFALKPGKVVIWFDLARQRKIISVDDGTLPKLPSRKEMKQRLADSIDVNEYVKLDSAGRYDVVMRQIKVLTNKMDTEAAAKAHSMLKRKETRKFDLIDLTAL